MAENTNNIVYRIEVDSKSGKINVDGVTKSFEQADKAFLKLQKDVSKGIPSATKNVKNLGDATGSATSATMELSRVISDAPYGIRGMANNITQLVSQMGTASMKAGGLTSALKLMGKQMLGPLGIVFAITAVVSALDFFFGANKKAEGAMDSFRVTASKAAVDLKSLLVVMKEDMLSKEDLADVVDKVNKKYKDLNLSIDEEGRLTKESRIQIDKKIKSMGNLALANAMMAEIEKKQSEIAKAAVELQEDTSKDLSKIGIKDLESFKQREDEKDEAYVERLNKMSQHQKGAYKGQISVDKVARVSRIKAELEAFEETKKRVSDQVKELLKISTTEGFFDKFFDSKDSSRRAKIAKREKVGLFDFKELQIGNGKYLKEIMKVEEKTVQLRTKSKIGSLEIQRHYHLQRLGKATGANKELIAAYEKYYDDLIRLEEEKLLGKSKIDPKKPTSMGATPDEIKEAQRLKTEARLEALMEAGSAIGNFLDGEYSREITREQNKTNALNNELRERLNNENLSKSERKSIQLEIARNDEALRIKQEVLEKKRFKTQKAINISQALLSTYLAAAQVQANPLALDPITKGIMMGATIATGLANVATIARQKFQSSAGATSTAGSLGGGGGGGNDRSFNFNLAGASRENQLANALQGRFDQPLQAFVVSRDITNAQQLDADIRTNASFG